MPSNQAFSRTTLRDPDTNRVVQDLYDKLQQAQAAIESLQSPSPAKADVKVSAGLDWIPIVGYTNNWKPSQNEPSYCVSGSLLFIRGYITGGTITNGTRLFEGLKLPQSNPFFQTVPVVSNGSGGFSTSVLSFSSEGTCVIFGCPVGTTTLYLNVILVLG